MVHKNGSSNLACTTYCVSLCAQTWLSRCCPNLFPPPLTPSANPSSISAPCCQIIITRSKTPINSFARCLKLVLNPFAACTASTCILLCLNFRRGKIHLDLKRRMNTIGSREGKGKNERVFFFFFCISLYNVSSKVTAASVGAIDYDYDQHPCSDYFP